MTNPWHWQRGITGTGPEPIALGAKMTKAEVLAEEMRAANPLFVVEPPDLGPAVWVDEKGDPIVCRMQMPDGSFLFCDERTYNHMLTVRDLDPPVIATRDKCMTATEIHELMYGYRQQGKSEAQRAALVGVPDMTASQQLRSHPDNPSGMATEPSTRDGGLITPWSSASSSSEEAWTARFGYDTELESVLVEWSTGMMTPVDDKRMIWLSDDFRLQVLPGWPTSVVKVTYDEHEFIFCCRDLVDLHVVWFGRELSSSGHVYRVMPNASEDDGD